MTEKRSLNILGEHNTNKEDKLPAPFSTEDLKYLRVKRGYPLEPNSRHPYVKDGIAIQGIDLTQSENTTFLKSILNDCLGTANQVEDEHLKNLGMVAGGFLRVIELGIIDRACTRKKENSCISVCTEKKNIEVYLYFRFTTNECPAGLRMMAKVKALLEDVLLQKIGQQFSNITVHCIHGGSPWELDDMLDQAQKSVLKSLLSQMNLQEIMDEPVVFH